MKDKCIKLLFYLLLIFIVINPIWPNYNTFNYLFIGAFLVLDILIILFTGIRKIKIDKVDLLLGLLPLFYLLPFVLNNNVFKFSLICYFILYEISLTLCILILKRNMNKKMINDLLVIICYSGFLYFIISLSYVAVPSFFKLFKISNYFGDTYINSIDRLYGMLDYCNSSALFFSIGTFISLFKIYENKDDDGMFLVTFFTNFCGFLITFSKMVSIAFILVLIVLIVLQFFMKRKKFLILVKELFCSIIIPVFLFVRLLRYYLINRNIIVFFILFILINCLFFIIYKVLGILDNKFKYSSLIILGILLVVSFVLVIKPISVSLLVSNVSYVDDYIVTDFILDKNTEYVVSFDVEGDSGDTYFEIGLLYVDELIPNGESVIKMRNKKHYEFRFVTEDDFEYYWLKLVDIDKDANFKISNFKINGEDYIINSLFVPYQYVHQLELTKYDKESVSHRFDYYCDAFDIIKDNHYVFGSGYGTFAYYAMQGNYDYLENDPHSYFFQLWLDVGIYGVIYVLGLIVLGIYYMWKYRKKKNKVIWFCIFSLCMIILPFDCVYSTMYLKVYLMLSFVMISSSLKKVS